MAFNDFNIFWKLMDFLILFMTISRGSLMKGSFMQKLNIFWKLMVETQFVFKAYRIFCYAYQQGTFNHSERFFNAKAYNDNNTNKHYNGPSI